MSLRIIYGRAGTGKSTFCYQEIKQQIEKNKKVYIITPEQFSFTAEKKLMESLEENAVISAEVLTFRRMAYRVMQEVGGATKITLSSLGKAMLLYHILDQKKDELTFLGKTDKNVDLIATTITELKKHNISKEQIESSIEKIKDSYLQYKMKDILLLYKAFEEQIQEHYIDENDILTILAEQLDQTTMFQNTIVYIDEFVGFTPQEYRIIEKLLRQAEQINVTICADKLQLQEEYLPEVDLFYANRITRNNFIDLANNWNIEREEDIYLERNYRYHNAELKHLEKYIYENQYGKYPEKTENIHLFLASNPYSEMEYVAKNIIQLVRKERISI